MRAREAEMEQQWSQEKTRRPAEEAERSRRSSRQPERERLSDAALTARAALEGAPLWELPPRRLEELAGWLGNQGMNALLEACYPSPEEAAFALPADEPATEPFPVPEGPAGAAEPPRGLTAAEPDLRAFDPAGLADGGGEADGAGV